MRRFAIIYQAQFLVALERCAKLARELEAATGRPVTQEALAGLQAELDAASANDAKNTETDKPSPSDPPEPRPKRPGHGPRPQPALETVTRLFVLDEADLACPACGGELRPLSGQVESSEMIDVIETKYELVIVQRQKYTCRCGSCVETAPGPDRVVAGGRFSLEFGLQVVLDKYLYHTPLERQVRMMAERNLEVDSQTLWDQLCVLSQDCKPTWEALRKRILAGTVMGLDQTCWPNLDEGATKAWQMWCLTSTDLVYHEICDDKSAETFKKLIGKFQGTVVCDAASAHAAGARGSPGVALSGCWAHVYRKYEEALPDYPDARVAVDLIKAMYEADRGAESASARAEVRRTVIRGHLDKLQQWLAQTMRTPRTTSLGKAMQYTLNNWLTLTRFVSAPDIWMDNNRTERGVRGPVVGRRNHFGSKSRRGTEVAAIFYSLIESAKLAGVPVAKYLRAVILANRANKGTVLLPGDFKA